MAGKKESLNDIPPENGQLNKMQSKKIRSIIEKTVGSHENALMAVKQYCMALPKIKVVCVKFSEADDANKIEVITSNTNYFFRLTNKSA